MCLTYFYPVNTWDSSKRDTSQVQFTTITGNLVKPRIRYQQCFFVLFIKHSNSCNQCYVITASKMTGEAFCTNKKQ